MRMMPPRPAALAARWGVPIAAHRATARWLGGRVPVTRFLEDGEEVFGAVSVHTPGHAEGHLCFEVGGVGGARRAVRAVRAGGGDLGVPVLVGEADLLRERGGGELARGAGVVHFALPARRWWDNIGFT